MTKQFSGLQPGDRLDERYEILDTIGQGGFGVVYRARQIAIDRIVALKVLLPEADEVDPQAVERFRREAQLISSLESPNTITLYEFGQTRDGLLYTVMEFARGVTLRDLLARVGPLPAQRMVHITRQILNSLHEAHQRGVIHRDLKPANIMVGEYAGQQDHVKVLDFGIAKVLKSGDTQSTLMLTGRIVGTPRYMAPEQLRGANPTPACDLYALGLIMYEMMTGQPAVTATDPMAQVQAQMHPQSFVLPPLPGVPASLVANVNKALNKDSLARFQAAEEMSRALETSSRMAAAVVAAPPLADQETRHLTHDQLGGAVPSLGMGGAQGASQAPQTGGSRVGGAAVSATPVESRGGGLKPAIIITALLFLAALGAVAFLMLGNHGPGPTGPDLSGLADIGVPDGGLPIAPDLAALAQLDIPTPDLAALNQVDLAVPDLAALSQLDIPVPDLAAALDAAAQAVDLAASVDAVAILDTADAGPAEVGPAVDAVVQADLAPEDVVSDTAVAVADTAVAVADTAVADTAPPPDVTPALDTAVAAVDATPAPDTAASQPTISIQITTEPTGARVQIDQDVLCEITPCSISVPADGTSVRIRVSKRGFDRRYVNVSASDAPSITVHLEPTGPASPTGPAIAPI